MKKYAIKLLCIYTCIALIFQPIPGICLAPPGLGIPQDILNSQLERDVFLWENRKKRVEPYPTIKKALIGIRNKENRFWERVAENLDHVYHVLKLLVNHINKNRKPSYRIKLGDITSYHMSEVIIPDIGKTLDGLLAHFMKHTEKRNKSSAMSLIKHIADIDDQISSIQPFATRKEMLEAVKNNEDNVWKRVVLDESHVMFLLELLLKEINRGKFWMKHKKMEEITAPLMRTCIPSLGVPLRGLLKQYVKMSEEKTERAGMTLLQKKIKIVYLSSEKKPYPTRQEMLRAVRARADWSKVVLSDNHVRYLLALLLKELNRGKKKSECKQLGDITVEEIIRTKIPEIGKSLKGMLEHYARKTSAKTLSAGLQTIHDQLGIRTIKPYRYKKEMICAVKNKERDCWDRAAKNKQHVLYLLKLLLKEINKDKQKTFHKYSEEITATDMKYIIVPEIGRSLTGLYEYYLEHPEEGLAGIKLIKKKFNIAHADKPYVYVEQMLAAVKKGRGEYWKHVWQKNQHDIFLLNLLLEEINKNKPQESHKALGEITAPELLHIYIPTIRKSLCGLYMYIQTLPADENGLTGIALMRARLDITRKINKPYASVKAMLEAVKTNTPDWNRVIKEKEHVLYLLKLLLHEVNAQRPKLWAMALGDMTSVELCTIKIPAINKTLKGLLECYRRKTLNGTLTEALECMRTETGITNLITEKKPYPSINAMLNAMRMNPDIERIVKNPAQVKYLLRLLVKELNKKRKLPHIKIGDINASHMRHIIIPEIKNSLSKLLNYYIQQTPEKTVIAGVQKMKLDCGIEDTLTAARKFPLESKEPDWDRIYMLFNKTNKINIRPQEIHTFLSSHYLSREEEKLLVKEMHDNENPAAIQAFIETSIKWVEPVVKKTIKNDFVLNSGDFDRIMQRQRMMLYRLAWRYDPTIGSFRNFVNTYKKDNNQGNINYVYGVIQDYRRKKTGSRRKSSAREHTGVADLRIETAAMNNQRTADNQEELTSDIQELLELIYNPSRKGLKERDIFIYLLHYQKYSSREIKLKLKSEMNITLSESSISLRIKKMLSVLTAHAISLNRKHAVQKRIAKQQNVRRSN